MLLSEGHFIPGSWQDSEELEDFGVCKGRHNQKSHFQVEQISSQTKVTSLSERGAQGHTKPDLVKISVAPSVSNLAALALLD